MHSESIARCKHYAGEAGILLHMFGKFMILKEYHTVRTVTKSNRKTKNTTLSEQLQNLIDKQRIPHCQNSYKI